MTDLNAKPPPTAPLPVRRSLAEALRLVLGRPLLLLNVGLVPLLLLVGLGLKPFYLPAGYWSLPPDSYWPDILVIAETAIWIILFGAYAIAWHRMALFGVDNQTRRVWRRIDRRHLAYFLLVAAAMLANTGGEWIGRHLADWLLWSRYGGYDQVERLAQLQVLPPEFLATALLKEGAILFLCDCALALLACRLFALFPAAAIGQPFAPATAWRRAAGHYWRVVAAFAAVFALALAFYGLLVLIPFYLIYMPPRIGAPPSLWVGIGGPVAMAVLGNICLLLQMALTAAVASRLYAHIIGPEQVASLKLAARRQV